ncbi:MAG TPA: NYN domain-containing protein, partial [Gemmatimonadales bacterium]|nr:NYN domain-containing protein [Gemmatimonadales bacterium]
MPAKQPPAHAPNAALLIDFDNVTMGIRSDLQHELKRLMNSDIIRGKVAVQRAYADWRRYPQYIVPLSEASIDLIFAPAFGSNKKNATDIRLAIDALELVFTRPEIGTFILLSGDSDFSSLVIKLKEYGKYIIGVGIRESSSDLLIQNCDEYYSYNELAGLTRVADEVLERRDPWELVVDAVLEMKKRDDVMRSDRLKQVMQELDPSFDEKNVGMNRFSKFIDEARRRGLIAANKLENGQYEIDLGPAAPGGPKALPPIPGGAEDRQSRERAERAAEAEGRGRRPRSGSGTVGEGMPLNEAFELLKRVLRELGGVAPGKVGEDPVRERMREILGRNDEPIFHRPKFGRFLRQAEDAGLITLSKNARGFEIALKAELAAPPAEPAVEAAPEKGRGRRGRGRAKGPKDETREAPPVEQPVGREVAAAAPPATVPVVASAGTPRVFRIRRGSGSSKPVATQIPLIGVVDLGEEEAAPAAKRGSRRSRTAAAAGGTKREKPASTSR